MKRFVSRIGTCALAISIAIPCNLANAISVGPSNYAKMINKEKAQQKRGIWVNAQKFTSFDAAKYPGLKPVTSSANMPNRCKKTQTGTQSSIRTVFFAGSANSSYVADQHDDSVSDITAEKHFPLTCSMSIVNYSQTIQYVRWGMVMTLQQEGTNRDAAGMSSNDGVVYRTNVTRAVQFNASKGNGITELNGETALNPPPSSSGWLEIKPGYAIDLKLDLGLPIGLPSAYKSASQNVPQFCTGYVQACDEVDAQYKGEIMVSGDMQYVQDAPNNIQIQYATALREKASDAGRVVTLAPNCFRDQSRGMVGVQSVTAQAVSSHACEDLDFDNPISGDQRYCYGDKAGQQLLYPAPYGTTEAIDLGYKRHHQGDPYTRDTATQERQVMKRYGDPSMGYNASMVFSNKAVARFYASRAMTATDQMMRDLGRRCAQVTGLADSDCWALFSFDRAMEQDRKGIELDHDIIEDVGAKRTFGQGTGTDQCFSYQDLEMKEGVLAFNKSLRTGMFPMHIGSVSIMVNGGQTF